MAAQRRTKKLLLGNNPPSFQPHNWADRILAVSRRNIHPWEKLTLGPEFAETRKSPLRNNLILEANRYRTFRLRTFASPAKTNALSAEANWTARSMKSGAPCRFTANYVVTLNDGSHAHPSAIFFHASFNADHSAQCADKHVRAVGNLGGERQCDVNFRPGLEILRNNKVEAARGDVPSLSFLCVSRAIRGHPNDDG
jgi:hypothetical protein